MERQQISLGNKLKDLRISRNWTTRELAEKIGVSQGMIPRYESGEATPRHDVVTKLAEVFDVSLNDLLEIKPVSITGLPFDAKRFEHSITDLRRLDERSKMLVQTLIEELVEMKKYKDYYTKIQSHDI